MELTSSGAGGGGYYNHMPDQHGYRNKVRIFVSLIHLQYNLIKRNVQISITYNNNARVMCLLVYFNFNLGLIPQGHAGKSVMTCPADDDIMIGYDRRMCAY